MSGIGGKGLVGPSVFAGLAEGAERGMNFALQYQHMKTMEQIARYRGFYGGVKDFLAAGGMDHDINGDETTPSGTMAESAARQRTSLTPGYGPRVSDLGGTAVAAE